MSQDDVVAAYPTQWEADVVLRDGGVAHVRPIRPEDGRALQAFHVGQSERSTYFRFFAPMERLTDADLRRFTHVDHDDRVAIVATQDEGEPATERIIAVARYDRVEDGTAEVAFNVADDHHGRGLGSVLLEHLAAAARERGVGRFVADVLPQNSRMISVFRDAGYAVRQALDDGILSVSFDLDPTERSLEVMADREHRAEARSVRGLLTPRHALVVHEPGDAGQEGAALAGTVTAHLDATGTVDVHVVGPFDAPTRAHRHPDVAAVPGPVDLLVLAVPAERAAAVVRSASRLHPRAVVVLTGGFAETGPQGVAHQRDLLRSAHAAGMRVLGPASFGFWRATSEAGPEVDVSLAAQRPAPGSLALFCQSAPLSVGLLAAAARRGVGLSTFVSSGHRADVSGNDLMQFWTDDVATGAVGLYLESIGNPRKFARVARRLAATKPVVAVVAGRAGHVQSPGHVLRGTRVPRQALDEVLAQSGVVRVDSPHQLLDACQALVLQPPPGGRRVAVLSTSGPMAALTAEAAASAGLTVTEQVLVPGHARAEEAVDAAFGTDCDAVVLVDVPALGGADVRVAASLARAAARSGRPAVACVAGLRGTTPELTAPDADGVERTVPAYATPEDAVTALAAAARWSAWRSGDRGRPVHLEGVERAAARRLVTAHLRGPEPVELDRETVGELLQAYGLRLWPSRVVGDVDSAVAAGDALGWPVALKSTVAHLRHRIDLGGVRLDLAGPVAVRDAWATMAEHLDHAGVPPDGRSYEVQPMAPGGAACVVRSAEDPRFGPVVSFGLAGDAVDLLGDVSHRVAPLTDVDVTEMIRSVRAAPRLFGYRGLPRLDVAALEDVVTRVAALADDLPELYGLELHPVVVGESGAAVLAARVQVAETGRADAGRRVLPT